MAKKLIFLLLFSVIANVSVSDGVIASVINSFNIGLETAKSYPEYMQYKVLGICTWVKKRPFPRPPSIVITPEVDYFAPDLVVTVFNKVGDNPWSEANLLDKVSHSGAQEFVASKYGVKLENTDIRDRFDKISSVAIKRKIVDVIGHPNMLLNIPIPILLLPDTIPFFPYYQSEADVLNTFGAIEKITRPVETLSVFNNFIGTITNHWGFMFPREMSAIIHNDYKAALVFAARAAHIVTNNNIGHVVKSTANSCGVNCRVSNVFFNPDEKYIKWQEIYPKNRPVKLGENDLNLASMGNEDYQKGQGNYIFVIWRRYQGCVQAPNHKLYKPGTTKIFTPTVKG